MDVLWPWGVADYPGIKRGLASTFANRAAWQSIVNWRVGKRRMPSWAWSLIAAEADRRIQALEHVRELAKKEAGL